MSHYRTNIDAARSFVEYGLSRKATGERESASGPGSTLTAALPSLKLIDEIVENFNITRMIDLGCGDWNWMKHAKWRDMPSILYEGWDAHEGMIEALTYEFGNERVQFKLADVITSSIPNVDLVICRDVFFHIDVDLAAKVIENIKQNARFLVSTSFLSEAHNRALVPYLPIENWGFYRINLDLAPFNLQKFRVKAMIESECSHEGRERSICLFDFHKT